VRNRHAANNQAAISDQRVDIKTVADAKISQVSPR
jgi:hypothetical protein